jgi:HAD superfamily hydrolase (TIGR01458 family)
VAWLPGGGGVLLDIDGTLLHGDDAIPGAPAALARLEGRGLPHALITNTTRRSRADISAVLRSAGLEVPYSAVLTPAALARRRIVDSGRPRTLLLVTDSARADFEDVEEVEEVGERPDWVVVGDLGPGFDWDRLNRAFRCLLDGAGFLALQRNRYWHAGEAGLVLDAGAFVAALEFAAGVTAEVMGKPSRPFYELALRSLDLPAGSVLVVGDDMENEGLGAHAAGCRSAIVRTGKFRAADLDASSFRPDLLLDSIADLG